MKNGYHPKYIDNCMKDHQPKPTKQAEKKEIYFGLPYLKDCHKILSTGIHKINRELKNTKILPYFKTFKTEHIFKNKDPIPFNVSSSLVYEFLCEHCQKCYIGETRRHLHTRIKEHVKGQPPSEITAHEHPPTLNSFKILIRTTNTKIAETLFIQKYKTEHRPLLNNFTSSEELLLF